MTIALHLPIFDNHVHGRRVPFMETLMAQIGSGCSGGALEPNTGPHLMTYEQVREYVHVARTLTNNPDWYASLYLTVHTSIEDIRRCWVERLITHVKWYPPEGTTGADASPSHELLYARSGPIFKILRFCAKLGVPVKYHPEITSWNGKPVVPHLREEYFYKYVAPQINDTHPNLRQIYAHISTRVGVDYLRKHGKAGHRVGEITIHHALFTVLDVFEGGKFRPNLHCWPNLKTPEDRDSIQGLLLERLPFVICGNDPAGHLEDLKHGPAVPGGIYTYHCAPELWIELFMELGLTQWAEHFFYHNARILHPFLPKDPRKICFVTKDWQVEEPLQVAGGGEVWPLGYDPDPDKRRTFKWKRSQF